MRYFFITKHLEDIGISIDMFLLKKSGALDQNIFWAVKLHCLILVSKYNSISLNTAVIKTMGIFIYLLTLNLLNKAGSVVKITLEMKGQS